MYEDKRGNCMKASCRRPLHFRKKRDGDCTFCEKWGKYIGKKWRTTLYFWKIRNWQVISSCACTMKQWNKTVCKQAEYVVAFSSKKLNTWFQIVDILWKMGEIYENIQFVIHYTNISELLIFSLWLITRSYPWLITHIQFVRDWLHQHIQRIITVTLKGGNTRGNQKNSYRVPTTSRLLKIIGLFCKRAL